MTDRATSGWLPWIPYPTVMLLGFVLFAVLLESGVPLIVSTYVPVLVTAALVTWLEWVFPYRLRWRPEPGEIKTDLSFMIVVQLLFPPLVGSPSPTRSSSRLVSRLAVHARVAARPADLAASCADDPRRGFRCGTGSTAGSTRTTRSGGCTPCITRWSSSTG